MVTPQEKLRLGLAELGRHRFKALVTLARARGIPKSGDGLEEVYAGKAGQFIPDMKALALATLVDEMLREEVAEGRETVCEAVRERLKRVTKLLPLERLVTRLHELSRRFKLLPTTCERRLLQRLIKGQFSVKRSFRGGAYTDQWLVGFAQAVNLRDALTYLIGRLERPQTEPPKVYAQVHGELSGRFRAVRPISRVTTQLAAQGVITSDATLLALRAGKYRSGDNYRVRPAKAQLILDALKNIQAA